MGYKKWNQNISFVDIALSSSLEKNRSLKTMDRINRVIDWTKVEGRLRDYYEIGRQEEGADAYPPLMLLLPARRLPGRGEGPTARRGSISREEKDPGGNGLR